MYAYVGSRTTRERNARGEGITVFRVTPFTGELTRIQVVGELVNPSYLVLNQAKTRLYAVHGDLDYVSAYKVNPSSGELTPINQESTQGKNPVHLALDPTERFLIVSNHLGGSLAVLPIGDDGELQALTQLLQLQGPVGPHRIEQTQVKPHYNGFDPSGKFVIVPDKGLDRVFSLQFVDGQLQAAPRPFVQTREGAGPRHHTFHPQLAIAYVANELDATVTAYAFDSSNGSLSPIQRLSSLPEHFAGDSRSAAIVIHPNGKTLYVSNRGHDSITAYAVDPDSGHLRFLESVPTQGKTPRFITIHPTGAWLYALNEDSDTITTFAINSSTGCLSHRTQDMACGSPVCLIFSE
jgi:6-phosphogluconolactonase (cycloisomerase 2 family)